MLKSVVIEHWPTPLDVAIHTPHPLFMMDFYVPIHLTNFSGSRAPYTRIGGTRIAILLVLEMRFDHVPEVEGPFFVAFPKRIRK